jgi:hypothetical protein
MSAKPYLTYQEVLAAAASWPALERVSLIQDLLQTLAPDPVGPDERSAAIERLEGILATSEPPPTDEDIDRMLEERRMERLH